MYKWQKRNQTFDSSLLKFMSVTFTQTVTGDTGSSSLQLFIHTPSSDTQQIHILMVLWFKHPEKNFIWKLEGKMTEGAVFTVTSAETIKYRDNADGFIFLSLFSPFLAFLLPLENQTHDNFINLRLIYSAVQFILEMDACFLKGQERYHSFRLFVALLYSHVFPPPLPSTPAVWLVWKRRMVGNKSRRLS